jgi:hypothetical protein
MSSRPSLTFSYLEVPMSWMWYLVVQVNVSTIVAIVASLAFSLLSSVDMQDSSYTCLEDVQNY